MRVAQAHVAAAFRGGRLFHLKGIPPRLDEISSTHKSLSSRPEQPAPSSAHAVRAARAVEGSWLDFRVTRITATIFAFAVLILILATAPPARAEYLVLRSGQRLSVSGYQLIGDTYHLQLQGGTADLPASEVVSIEPEEIFTKELPPPPAATDPKARYRDLILSAASRYRVDPDLITSIIAAESNFDPRAISRRNARGLMQLLPETAAQLGVKNIFDPTENIDAGTRYLSTLLDRYHYNLALTLAAYNAGPQSVDRYRSVPPYRETHSYINKVSRSYAQRKTPATATPDNAKPKTMVARSVAAATNTTPSAPSRP
jgi:hypothetical protein